METKDKIPIMKDKVFNVGLGTRLDYIVSMTERKNLP